jgi:predicted nucleic acid-binding protein
VVVDASAMVDLLVGSAVSAAVRQRLRGCELHTPAHFDAEVLSALGRLVHGRHFSARLATSRVDSLRNAPIERHLLTELVNGAWGRRNNLRVVDAIYAELSEQIEAILVTTDAKMAAAVADADLITA